MFGEGKKNSGKPVRGYRWMFFTFLMSRVLCLIGMYHKEFEEAKSKFAKKVKDTASSGFDTIIGTKKKEEVKHV
jgi:hypothetical protein